MEIIQDKIEITRKENEMIEVLIELWEPFTDSDKFSKPYNSQRRKSIILEQSLKQWEYWIHELKYRAHYEKFWWWETKEIVNYLEFKIFGTGCIEN